MKRLFHLAEEYLEGCDWKLLAVLKLCLLSLGMLVGVSLPQRYRRGVILTCLPLFLLTYLPLMERLVRVWKKGSPKDPSLL